MRIPDDGMVRTISLWQPWATLVALGSKRIETRHWPTNHRGPIAIHAAKRKNQSELIHYGCCWNFCAGLHPIKKMADRQFLADVLPFGAIIAVANLVDCRPTESFTVGELDTRRYREGALNLNDTLDSWRERDFGNYLPGRFGWILEDIVALPEPLPWKGSQGFFNVPASEFPAGIFDTEAVTSP
jgi:hypothetical protein